MNNQIIIDSYKDPETSHQLQKAIIYENGQVYEQHYEYADMEPFNSNMYYVIQNFIVKDNYILSKSDLKNGTVVLERGKDKIFLYPRTKEIEIFEYKKMRIM